MTLDQFVAKYNGGAASYDGLEENYGQCEQLVCCYWKEVYGFNCPPIPAAKDLWTNPTVLNSFGQIPLGQEQAGDVAVWGASSLINSPEFGHTDIALSPGFTGFDSNWGGVKTPEGYPAAHQVKHNYTDVLGFLRFKGGSMATDSLTKEEIAGIYQLAFDNDDYPQDLINAYTGKGLDGLVTQLLADPSYQAHKLQVNNPSVQVGFKPYSGVELFVKE